MAANVSGSDWRDWGLALAGHCGGLGPDTDTLACADTHLWASVLK